MAGNELSGLAFSCAFARMLFARMFFRTECELNELQKCSMSVSNISRAASAMKNPRFGFDVYSMDFWWITKVCLCVGEFGPRLEKSGKAGKPIDATHGSQIETTVSANTFPWVVPCNNTQHLWNLNPQKPARSETQISEGTKAIELISVYGWTFCK